VLAEQVEPGPHAEVMQVSRRELDLFSIAADVFGKGVRGVACLSCDTEPHLSLAKQSHSRYTASRNPPPEIAFSVSPGDNSQSRNRIHSAWCARTRDTSRDDNPSVTEIHHISSVTPKDGFRT